MLVQNHHFCALCFPSPYLAFRSATFLVCHLLAMASSAASDGPRIVPAQDAREAGEFSTEIDIEILHLREGQKLVETH